MADPRTIVERELGRVDVRPFTLDTFHSRRERTRRNQRLAAGAVGVSIALAIAVVASQLLDVNRDRTAGRSFENGVIAFEGNRGLFLSNADGTGSHAVLRSVPDPPGECLSDSEHPCDYRGLAWSPDGKQLAFVFGEISAGLFGDMSLYVMDATTEDVRLLASCPDEPRDEAGTCDNGSRLSWSPDASRLVFSSGADLFVADTRTGELTQITGCASCAYLGLARYPGWSPSGDWIVFSGADSIGVVSPDGARSQMVERSSDTSIDIVNGSRAEWSPDGARLVFPTNRGIFVVRADGSALRLLVGEQFGEAPGSPSWSPDGQRIVYVNTPNTTDGYSIVIRSVDLDGTQDRLIYRDCCVYDWGGPVYSPDGSQITFSVGLDDSFGVFVMTAAGNDVQRLPGYGEPACQALP